MIASTHTGTPERRKSFFRYAYRRSPDQDRMPPAQHPVVVVGAGPVGLTAAIDLALRQVPVVLLDDSDRIERRRRAGRTHRDDEQFLGRENRDRKRPLTPIGESTVRWLYDAPCLPENLLLHIDAETRERIFDPLPERRRRPSGQERINMLFRLVQRRIVNRASVLTIAQQRDSPKRARDARLPENLGNEGILVFGHQENDPLVAALHTAFVNLPQEVRAVVLSGEGEHFCAGLDLSELQERDVAEAVVHSRNWHAAFDAIQFGRVPVIAVLHGAVVGGGLELAAAAHIRIAERSAYYGLPEGTRGIFVGGGGSARIPRLIGTARMTDMMLTGRVHDAEEGQRIGLTQYLVDEGAGLAKAFELAGRVAANAPLSNFAILQALPRIAEMAPGEGLFVESLMSAIASGDPAAKSRIRDFLAGKAAKVQKS